MPMTSFARIVKLPREVFMVKPKVESCWRHFAIGSSKRVVIDFVGPIHRPQTIMFSAFIRICAGRFRMTRYTGHKLTGDDLYRGTPSVDSERAKLFWLEKKRPGAHNGCNADPSQTS